MRCFKHEIEIALAIELDEPNAEMDGLPVVIWCELMVENDSIGSYEYWGAKCYDSQPDYLTAQSDIEWDKTKYTEAENAAIAEYITTNEEKLYDRIIKHCENQNSEY